MDLWDLVECDPEHLHFHQPPGVFLPPCGDRTTLRFLPSPGRLPGGADLQERGDKREDQAAELDCRIRGVWESLAVRSSGGQALEQGGGHRQACEADPSRAAGQACPAHRPTGRVTAIQAQGWGPHPGEPQVLGRGVCLYGWGLQGGRRAGSRQVHLPMTRGARHA